MEPHPTERRPLPAMRMRSRDGWALTDRQRDILALASYGRTRSEIAEVIGVKTETVKNHLTAIRQRTNYDGTMTGLVLEAIARGVIPFPEGKAAE